MYAKIKNSQIVQYPYGYSELQNDNPYTNFNGANVYDAFQGTDENLAGAELVEVQIEQTPTYDDKTQRVVFATSPVFNGGNWVIACTVVSKTSEELAQQDAGQANSVRSQRNAKLSQCDWTQLADSAADKAAWAAYRQELRDVPAQTGFPWEVTWPTQP